MKMNFLTDLFVICSNFAIAESQKAALIPTERGGGVGGGRG